jgi:DNA-binding response OmpR family regulator
LLHAEWFVLGNLALGLGLTFGARFIGLRLTIIQEDQELRPVHDIKSQRDSLPCILLVEDEKPVRDVVASILRSAGFACCKAEDGEAAMSLLASGARISLVLSNLLLPEVDGFTLLVHVKKHYPGVPFAFVTAVNDDSVRQAAVREGAADYLLKPFTCEELLATVRRVLGRRTA